ncbi:hypothetical protein SAMN05192575_101429 [Nocardioides alpinus]|uniref:Cell envelope-related transcriptional attenuator domain-containing protein n=1 Tax=Nocardioides alpinus TaxID=748909 RepID=A0A1I0VTN5_9ACTN|nr:hypothetical protein [Nocardioides alpinus]PKH37449.1 hypothetical protein CXG46_18545 [Nocardioides alpinus]SFA79323.1 hypothetical protein SAMN05192575_101429 [Nocardioides alpinus]
MARVVRRLLRVVLALGLAVAMVGLGLNVAMASRLDRIEGAFAGLTDRPPPADGKTVLVVGTRTGGAGPDVPWLSGEQSVEAVMLIEVPPDGLSAEVESLPASSGIRPVVATSSPSTGVGLVEEWSGRRVDHVIAIDWDTFVRLADDNGVDPAYAYGSGPAAQHDFLGRVLEGTLHAELRKQPLNLLQALRTTAAGTAVDDGWSVVELDLMVLSLRNLRSSEITFSMAQPG